MIVKNSLTMRRGRRAAGMLSAVFTALVLCAACTRSGAAEYQPPTPEETAVIAPAEKTLPPAPSVTPAPQNTPAPVQKQTICLRAVGDLMVHERQLLSAQVHEDYDFTSNFEVIAPFIKSADMALGNLETTISDGNFSGFPSFRSPIAYIEAIAEAGFDVLTVANNHSFDGGARGIMITNAAIETHGMHHTGSYATEDAAKKVLIRDVNGIKIAVLAYAGMNFRCPDWQINTLANTKKIEADILAAQNGGADIIIAMVHWGNEYSAHVSSHQESAAQRLAEAGVDIILGSHPHVVQRAQWLERSDGRRCFVAYSMGNFLSNQREQNPPTDGGVILDIRITKDFESGECAVDEITCIPTHVLRREIRGRLCTYTVLPIEKTLEEGTISLTASERRRVEKLLEYTSRMLLDIPTVKE